MVIVTVAINSNGDTVVTAARIIPIISTIVVVLIIIE